MKRILFLSRDPGGTNCLIPVIRCLEKEAECIVYGKDMAISAYRNEGIECIDIELEGGEDEKIYLLRVLEKESPDIVVTGTSSDDFIEREMWDCCKSRGIISIGILDAWVNYSVRFSDFRVQDINDRDIEITCVPDFVLVMDEYAKEGMISCGHSENYLASVGHPHLEYIYQKYSNASQIAVDTYRRSLGANGKKIILFISDNISASFPFEESYWGFDEKSTFDDLLRALSSLSDEGYNIDEYLIVVRPHPKEDREYWIRKKGETKVPMVVDMEADGVISVLACDLAVGMFSMMLTEAAIAGKRTMSIQLNAKRDAGFFLEQRGYIKPYFDYESMKKGLADYIEGEMSDAILGDYFKGSIKKTSDFIMDHIK